MNPSLLLAGVAIGFALSGRVRLFVGAVVALAFGGYLAATLDVNPLGTFSASAVNVAVGATVGNLLARKWGRRRVETR